MINANTKIEEKEEEQGLFGNLDQFSNWSQEWNGMPEFKMKDLTSHKKIIVHFRNDEDFKSFSELMNQKIGPKQPSIWYPQMPHRIASGHHYV